MPDFSKSDVAAIVVSYNSADVLADCLQALSASGIVTIVVDNASHDGSREIAKQFGATLIANENNEGYGRANNIGIAAADTAEFCLIVNPDARIDAGLVEAFLIAAARYPEAAIFGPKIIEPDGRIFHRPKSILESGVFTNSNLSSDRDHEVINLSGACLFLRRERFREVGGFDRQIFLFYEDDDLCYRARRHGWKLMKISNAVARHNRGHSTVRSFAMTYRTRFHQAWSRQYVLRKHGRQRDALSILLRSAVKYGAAVLAGNYARVARHKGSLAGTWAALKGQAALQREGLE